MTDTALAEPQESNLDIAIGTGRAALSELTFQFHDEIVGGVGAAYEWGKSFYNDDTRSFSEIYDDNVAAERAKEAAFAENHPLLDAGARVTGTAASFFIPVFGAGLGATRVGVGVTRMGLMVRGAATGAAEGGLYGFGAAEGGLENRLEAAKSGATIGGVTGGIVGAAVRVPHVAGKDFDLAHAPGAAPSVGQRASNEIAPAATHPPVPAEYRHLSQMVSSAYTRTLSAAKKGMPAAGRGIRDLGHDAGATGVGILANGMLNAPPALRKTAMVAGTGALLAGIEATNGLLDVATAAGQIATSMVESAATLASNLSKDRANAAMHQVGVETYRKINEQPHLGFGGAIKESTREALAREQRNRARETAFAEAGL